MESETNVASDFPTLKQGPPKKGRARKQRLYRPQRGALSSLDPLCHMLAARSGAAAGGQNVWTKRDRMGPVNTHPVVPRV